MIAAEQFNIGGAAIRCGVSAKRALRCESLGLLPAVPRTEFGDRRCGEKELHTLRFVRRERDLVAPSKRLQELQPTTAQWRMPVNACPAAPLPSR
jgi:MerR family transcriptional regulator, copper efflux regulator